MKDIHKQFVFYGQEARKWMRKCELLLPEIAKQEIWKKKRFGSIYEYAGKLAGMNRDKVNECLRVLNNIENKPELKKVAEEKGINSVKPVAVISTPETAEFWAEKAKNMPKNALEKYVQSYRLELLPRKAAVSVNLSPDLAKRFEQFKQRADFEELLEKFMDEVEDDKPEAVETDSRHIPAAIEKHVRRRSGDCCEYPDCGRKAEIFHHTARFATHKCHDPSKIYHLCEGHERLAHLGLIENEELGPRHWRLREKASPTETDRLVAKYRGRGG
ncbi:MAG: hypothetical protein ABII07_04105 [Patescibacteria group bacterium]